MPATVSAHHGLHAHNAARHALTRLLGDGGRPLDASTWQDGSGSVLGLRQADGDSWLVVSLDAAEAHACELAFCQAKVAEFSARAAESQAMACRWPHRAQMAAFDRAEAERWAAKVAALRESAAA